MLRQAEAQQEQEENDGDYELPPELHDAWQCFLLTLSQWRVQVGLTSVFYDGIDRSSLFSCMQMLGIKRRKQRDVLLQIQIIESEARVHRNKE